MKFSGISEGFVVTKNLHWAYYDVNAYAGYMDSNKTIYIVMRGTDSPPHQDMDLDSVLVDYTTWPECNCRVHRGVDRGVNGIYAELYVEFQRLRALKPDYEIQVNGHSLGASLAQLTAMKLEKDGIETKVIAIAGFRVGDADFAAFYNKMTHDHYRVVHH